MHQICWAPAILISKHHSHFTTLDLGLAMAEKENLDIPMIVTAGIVSVALTIASVIGVQALYYAYQKQEVERKGDVAPNGLGKQQAGGTGRETGSIRLGRSRKGNGGDSD